MAQRRASAIGSDALDVRGSILRVAVKVQVAKLGTAVDCSRKHLKSV